MANPVTKRFSNVRYWRYIFTPIVFLIIAISLYLIFTGDVTMTSTFNSLTSSYRKNTANLPAAGFNLGRK